MTGGPKRKLHNVHWDTHRENFLYDESLTLEVRFVYQLSDDALHRT